MRRSQPAGASIPAVTGFIGRGSKAINPAGVRTNPTPPPVFVERVEADGAPLEGGSAFTVAPGRGQLEFHYTAIDLSAPERVRFGYKWEGYDTDWVEAGGRRAAYFTNLPPGRYQFHVIACNDDGVWQEAPVGIELVLEPHFYQTALVLRAACRRRRAVASGGLVLDPAAPGPREDLARCVADRTRQLRAEVEEHARTGERLRQSPEVGGIGQLAGGVAHDFNNLLTVINGYAHLLLGVRAPESPKAAGDARSICSPRRPPGPKNSPVGAPGFQPADRFWSRRILDTERRGERHRETAARAGDRRGHHLDRDPGPCRSGQGRPGATSAGTRQPVRERA